MTPRDIREAARLAEAYDGRRITDFEHREIYEPSLADKAWLIGLSLVICACLVGLGYALRGMAGC